MCVSSLRGNRETPRPTTGTLPIWSASGRRGAVADDARTWGVRLRHSSCEADEQGGAIRCGAGGAKGGGRGECEPAKHAPGTVPGARVTGAGAHTARRENIAKCRYIPEGGAVCLNWASTDLCGGREVTRVPTAIIALDQAILFVAVRGAYARQPFCSAPKKKQGPRRGPCIKSILVFRRGTPPIIVIEVVFLRIGQSLVLRDRTRGFRLQLLWQLVNEV